MPDQNLKQRIDIVVEYLDEIEHPPMKGTVLELWAALEKAEDERDAAVALIEKLKAERDAAREALRAIADCPLYTDPMTPEMKAWADSVVKRLEKMEEKCVVSDFNPLLPIDQLPTEIQQDIKTERGLKPAKKMEEK